MEDGWLLDELRRVLSYNPTTGVFRWLIKGYGGGRSIPVGTEAGTLKDGYIIIGFTFSDGKKRLFRAHRLAFWFVTGAMPKEVDHIDRNRSNNAWDNLREVTRTQNNHNGGLRPDNVSGKKGVSWVARDGKWLARITVNGRHIDRRGFLTVEDAIAARKVLELEYMGRSSPS